MERIKASPILKKEDLLKWIGDELIFSHQLSPEEQDWGRFSLRTPFPDFLHTPSPFNPCPQSPRRGFRVYILESDEVGGGRGDIQDVILSPRDWVRKQVREGWFGDVRMGYIITQYDGDKGIYLTCVSTGEVWKGEIDPLRALNIIRNRGWMNAIDVWTSICEEYMYEQYMYGQILSRNEMLLVKQAVVNRRDDGGIALNPPENTFFTLLELSLQAAGRGDWTTAIELVTELDYLPFLLQLDEHLREIAPEELNNWKRDYQIFTDIDLAGAIFPEGEESPYPFFEVEVTYLIRGYLESLITLQAGITACEKEEDPNVRANMKLVVTRRWWREYKDAREKLLKGLNTMMGKKSLPKGERERRWRRRENRSNLNRIHNFFRERGVLLPTFSGPLFSGGNK